MIGMNSSMSATICTGVYVVETGRDDGRLSLVAAEALLHKEV
jgi:hypothetical protein